MRHSLLLAFPALCLATEAQQPLVDKLKTWWNKATASVASVASNVPTVIPNPLDAGAAKVAEVAVASLNASNWNSILTPEEVKFNSEPYEWMVYVGGGRKSCYDQCEQAEQAWNTTAALLSVQPNSPSLAQVDCDNQALLCAMWSVTPPAIYHFLLSPTADPIARWIPLNHTEVTASDIAEIHTKRGFEEVEPYTGLFQPWTGILAKTGLTIPYGYVMYALSSLPAWVPMIVLSMMSRTLFGRRLNQERRPGTVPAARAPAPAAAPKK